MRGKSPFSHIPAFSSLTTSPAGSFRIQNPLHGIPQDKLLAQVEEFTKEKGFDEYTETFKKGALLAQRPGSFETLPLLDEADREAIRREKTRMSRV